MQIPRVKIFETKDQGVVKIGMPERQMRRKRRTAHAEKKAAALIIVNREQVSQTHASSSLDVQRTPLSNITNTHINGVLCTAATSVSVEHRSEDIDVVSKKRSGPGWYAHLSDEKKAEHLKKLRMARLQKKSIDLIANVNVPQYSAPQVSSGISQLESAQSGVSQILDPMHAM